MSGIAAGKVSIVSTNTYCDMDWGHTRLHDTTNYASPLKHPDTSIGPQRFYTTSASVTASPADQFKYPI